MYVAYVDASAGREYAGIGYAIFKDNQLVYKRRQKVPTIKSEDLEYTAILSLLRAINKLGIKNVIINTDCRNIYIQLRQIGSGKRIKNTTIREIIYEITINPTARIKWIPREENIIAHDLCRESMHGMEDLEYIDLYLEMNQQTKTRMTQKFIRHKKHSIKRCSCCKEYKSVIDFPRDKRIKICNMCSSNLDKIQYAYIKVKNTY